MPKSNEPNMNCMPKYVSHVLGKKWVLPILEELSFERKGMGFNMLMEKLKFITPRDLSMLLTQLVSIKLVSKANVKAGKKPAYKITESGDEFYGILKQIKELSAKIKTPKGVKVDCYRTRCVECKYYALDYAEQTKS